MDDRQAIENFLMTRTEESFCALFEMVYPRVRRYFLLRFIEELSYEELAVALGIPVGTVKWRLFSAKRKLAPIINAALPKSSRRIN